MEPVAAVGRHTRVGVEQAETSSRASSDEPFDEFYAREFRRAVQLSWLLTHSATASEDIAQEAFVSLHRRYDQLINPAAYLTKTITNLCRSWHRNLFRRASLLHRLAQRVDDASADEDYLIDAIARLPYRQRVVIIGRFWAGLSEADLADTLSVRPGTVKSLASRALARLRQEVPQ